MISDLIKDLNKSIQEVKQYGESNYGQWCYDVDVRDGGRFIREEHISYPDWSNALYSQEEVLTMALNKLIKIEEVLNDYVRHDEGDKSLSLDTSNLFRIGVVGVDSGQVMIVDPFYLSKWKNNSLTFRVGIRKGSKKFYRHSDYTHYDEPIDLINKTPNQLLEEGWESFREYPNWGEFSYDGISQLTMKDICGQLENFAVGSSSGLGDGGYPVYAEIRDEGDMGERVRRLIVDFNYDNDETFKEVPEKNDS